jgi:hypothetical protein
MGAVDRRWNCPSWCLRLRYAALTSSALHDDALDDEQIPLKVIVAAVTSFQLGLTVEGLSGVHPRTRGTPGVIQPWLDTSEAGRSLP